MPYRESPMQETLAPARWPAPDYAGEAEVMRAWLPPDETVGHLVIQDDSALVFFSIAGPDNPAAYGVRLIVQEILRISIEDGLTARETWNRAQAAAMWEAPEIRPLPELVEQLRAEWPATE